MIHALYIWLRQTGRVVVPTLTVVVIVFLPSSAFGQDPTKADSLIQIDLDNLPDVALKRVASLNVSDADLGDVLRGLSVEYDINIHVGEHVHFPVTARLVDIPLIDVLLYFCREYGLRLEQSGSIFMVRVPVVDPPPPAPINIVYENDLLSYDLTDAPVRDVARLLFERSGINVVVRQGLSGSMTGFLNEVSFGTGLRILAENNGFSLREREGLYVIDRGGFTGGEQTSGASWVHFEDGKIDLDVSEVPVRDVLLEVAAQTKLSLVTYELPETSISIRAGGLSVDQALDVLLRGTGINYQKIDDLYLIGRKDPSGVVTARLIRLSHIRAEGVIEQLPSNLTDGATIHLSREHNGIIVQAPGDLLNELEAYITALDQPMPQVIIEALVVDFEEVDLRELGFSFGRFGAGDSTSRKSSVQFGEGSQGSRGLSVNLGANEVENGINSAGRVLSLPSIGRLPSDFYLRIRALENEGKARVLSRPQIATLSGHPADLSVGTTQYFLLKSSTPIQTGNQYVPIESERFEKIEANISLQVTPWVTSSGEITTEIRPEFSTPVGTFDSSVPPTINTRVLDSTVRLKDGETIILGGLIQEATDEDHNKVPILGDIPLLGRLFRSSSTMKRKSVLVIYLTPHVFFGDERDAEKWDALRQRLDLPDPNGDSLPDGSTDGE